MPLDGREAVLAEMKARLDTLTDAGSVRRLALGTIPEGELPRVLMFDGGETRPDPAQDVGGEGGPPFFVMSPAVLVVVSGEDDGTLGPTLSGWVAAVKLAVGLDSATGLPDPSFGQRLQWATCQGIEPATPVAAAEGGAPLVAQQVNFRFARPESELNPYLATGV